VKVARCVLRGRDDGDVVSLPDCLGLSASWVRADLPRTSISKKVQFLYVESGGHSVCWVGIIGDLGTNIQFGKWSEVAAEVGNLHG
jgi:hypothetical protein